MAKTQAQRAKEFHDRKVKNEDRKQNNLHKGPQQFTKPIAVPYNFVRLPKQVIPAEFWKSDSSKDMTALYKQHVLTNGKNSGYIDIDILTQTPLFIGGNVVEKNGEEYQEFFGGNDNPIIPGSSLKSMIKQILKIVTASGFKAYNSESGVGDFEDRRLFYREVGKSSSEYRRIMVKDTFGKKRSETKAQAGFLIKTNNHKFYIINAKFDVFEYDEFPDLESKKDRAGVDWETGYVNIHTGSMSSKKSFVRIFKPNDFSINQVKISDKIIENYEYDYKYNRVVANKNAIDLLEIGKQCVGKTDDAAQKFTGRSDVTYVVPCFYIAKDGEVQHFGHGRFYRIPYDKSIGNHLPEELEDQNRIVDLTESILGRSRDWAGRVSFSEAHLCNKPEWCECSKPQPLMGPKPTSFQFYLNQNSKTDKCENWNNEGATIRGYKLYWHQSTNKAKAWKSPSNKASDKLSKYIQPIDSGMNFKSRIYFDNLSDIELGALLLTLNLDRLYTAEDKNKSISYKLGKGKSIGLGSIELNSSLHILDRAKRYHTLFNNDMWQLGESDMSKDTFINAFLKYRDDILGENLSNYDEMRKELLTMMNWNIANGEETVAHWDEAMTMMPIDNKKDRRFRDRIKLDSPKSFIEKWSK